MEGDIGLKWKGREGKKGKLLIVTKTRVESTSKGRGKFSKERRKYKIEDKSVSK